jgi:hypothetical protein
LAVERGAIRESSPVGVTGTSIKEKSRAILIGLAPYYPGRSDMPSSAFIAGACVRKLGMKFPSVLGEFGNSTERACTGWPDRIYLIDAQGQVAYKSKPG